MNKLWENFNDFMEWAFHWRTPDWIGMTVMIIVILTVCMVGFFYVILWMNLPEIAGVLTLYVFYRFCKGVYVAYKKHKGY